MEAESRLQRLFTGVVLLLAVDVIWVASSEFTTYIFKDLKYSKPFFTTWFKTALFSVYLLGFCCFRPWRRNLRDAFDSASVTTTSSNGLYRRVDEIDAEDDDEVDDEEDEDSFRRSFSSPTFIPANIPTSSGASTSGESAKSSGDEEDIRRVRFKRVAQVVEMNAGADALYANLARLSYNAHLR